MRKIYKNHVFQRSPKPWQWLVIISFAVATLSSVGAFFAARNWLGDGKYLQSIDIDQIEVLRLIPALKDLQLQVTGTHALDSEFFNNLKKTDRLLRSMTDDVKGSAIDNGSASTNAIAVAPLTTNPRVVSAANASKLQSSGKSPSEDGNALETLSDNPVLAFFQKLDSKIMKVVFGKPDKYADPVTDDPKPNLQIPEQKSTNVNDIQDILIGAKTAEQSLAMVLTQEKSLAGLEILAKSAETLVSTKSPLDVDKQAAESPVKKYSEALAEFVKANALWQKNITSPDAIAALQKSLGAVIDQKVLIEIEAGKKTSGKSTLSLSQAMPKVHQSPWHTKLPLESAASLKLYANNIQVVREFASDHEALRAVALKNSKGLRLFDFNTAGGFLGLCLLSIFGLVGVGLGGGMLYKNIRSAPVQDVRVTKLASAADELLGAIDLNLGATENANTQEPTSKIEPRVPDTFEDKNDLKTAINIGNQDLKTVSNVITEFSQDLKEKVLSIESHLQMLGQVGNKLRHSVSTLQDKSAQMRASAVEQSEDIYDAANSAPRGGPLDQLQDAFFALKQQGIRLYLAILDNHSSKQLALETEQLNLLVERIELAVSKMRASLAQALDQASDARVVTPQVSPEVVELLNMDAKQAIRDLDLWQQEFDALSRTFVEFKRDIKA
jgi:hypothetical protein